MLARMPATDPREPIAAAAGKRWVQLAQLRGRIARLARGGQLDVVASLMPELVRADLALALPADGLLRARQAAQLAEEHGAPTAGPLIVLAATLLAADSYAPALDAAALAIARATDAERARIAVLADLVAGAALRRTHQLAAARTRLVAARRAAASRGDAALVALAVVELAWIDHEEDQPAAAAACFEFATELFRRIGDIARAVETAVLAVASWTTAGELERVADRAARASDAARSAGRADLVAFVDGALADAALAQRGAAAAEACALAAETARALPDSPFARELRAAARLRQLRAAEDRLDRDRHLEAGLDLALGLPAARAGACVGAALVGLLDDAARAAIDPNRTEVQRLASALARLGDPELAAMAESVVAELG